MTEWLTEATRWLSSSVGVAVVGALLGLGVFIAVVAYLLSEWGERRQRKTELKGLLRILEIEIAGNKRQVHIFDEHPAWITQAPANSLQTKAWEDTRARLAHLLKNEKQFDDIARYYWNVQEVKRYLLDNTSAETSEEHRHKHLTPQLRLLLDLSDIARGHIRKHINPPKYLEEEPVPAPSPTPPAETSSQTSSSWWSRLFGYRRQG
jgi:hypothetical protein